MGQRPFPIGILCVAGVFTSAGKRVWWYGQLGVQCWLASLLKEKSQKRVLNTTSALCFSACEMGMLKLRC